MAMLLRMGGIPTRVVTGFTPGGYSKSKQAWIVRDTDAHSWVEAWFDDWGWVTFDPTPAGTPARSQIAALERPAEEAGTDRGDAAAGDAGSASRIGGVRPDLLGTQSGPGGVGGGGGLGVGRRRLVVVVRARRPVRLRCWSRGWCCAGGGGRWGRPPRWTARSRSSRRRCAASGRPAAAGTTLQQLEDRLGRTPAAAAYLRALRAGRYAPTAVAPPRGGRRALRRELASGRGPAGLLRALWALPPWRA